MRAPRWASSRFLPAATTIEGLNAPSPSRRPAPRARARRPRRRLRRPVRPAHRPPGARADGVLRDRPATASRPPRSPTRQPAALILSGGPKSVHVDGAPALDPAIYELGIPILGICYGAQLIAQQLGGTVGRGMRGEYGRAKLRRTGAVAAAPRRRPRRPRRVDEPLRRHHRGAGRVRRDGRRPTTPRSPCSRTTTAAIYGVQFHPEVVHSPVRHGRAAALPARARRVPADWTMSSVIDEQVARDPRPGRRRAGDLRAVRRRRLVGRRGARAPGHRPPADVHLRRHRADAQGRERPGRRDVPAQHGHRADPRRRRRPLLRDASPASPTRRPSARRSATVHPHLRGAHRRAHRGQVPRPGHALPRPHRVAAAPTAPPR